MPDQTTTTQTPVAQWQAAMGITDPATWRAVPADCNPSGSPDGAWAVVAGDGEEADIYCEVTAEHPRAVAELIVAAIRAHALRGNQGDPLTLWLALGEKLGAPEPPPVHLRRANADSTWSLCGHGGGETRALLTDAPAIVTCMACLCSIDYRAVNERGRRQEATNA